MSPLPSRFQLLPCTIFWGIFSYLPSSSYPMSTEKATVSIMHTCHSWRTAYMRKYLSALDVHYGQDNKAVISFQNIDIPFDVHVYPIDKLVRTLTITIPFWSSVTKGEIVNWMQTSAVFSSIAFISVTTLVVDAPYNRKTHIPDIEETLDNAKNAAAFFRHIKLLAPNAKNIKLLIPGCQGWSSENRYINLVESSIAELVCGCSFTFREKLDIYNLSTLSPMAISELTSLCLALDLSFSSPYSSAWLFKIAQHNAKTLKCIMLSTFSINILDQFLFSGGLPTIYSSVVKMEVVIIDWYEQTSEASEPVDFISSEHRGIDVNHFPVLKSLKFTGSFRHIIGYLFGSENRALEYFDATDLINNLDRGNVLPVDMSTRFYRLKTVILDIKSQDGETMSDLTRYKTLCSQIFKSIACPSTIYCISMGFKVGRNMLELLNVYDIRPTLQRLSITNTLFLFADLFNLLTKAPMLQYLYCSLNDEPPFVNDIDLRENPEYLKEHYYPLGKSLSKLMLGYNYDYNTQNIHNISWSAHLLACLYPRLINLGLAVGNRNEYGPSTFYRTLDKNASLSKQADLLRSYIKKLPLHLPMPEELRLSRGILLSDIK